MRIVEILWGEELFNIGNERNVVDSRRTVNIFIGQNELGLRVTGVLCASRECLGLHWNGEYGMMIRRFVNIDEELIL